MRRVTSILLRRALAAVGCVVVAAGCETVAGIEEHVYDPNGGTSALCREYCDVVMQSCIAQNAVYAARATCLGVCGRLPAGDPLEPGNGNTIACRKHQAELAKATGEPTVHCPQAGPGGAGTCGTNCASYCQLLPLICPGNAAELSRCEQQCASLKDTGTLDAVADDQGDTLQCRLVHVSNATVDPSTHCPHTQLHPSGPCQNDPTALPKCKDFCGLAMSACVGAFAPYESITQCLAVCAALPSGTNGDHTQNTVGCRLWHSYNALLDPAAHCSHVAPGGEGHCGQDMPNKTGNCESYCTLLAKACPGQFAATYPSQAGCQASCSNQPDSFGAGHNSPYQIASAQSGNTMQCRLLHVSRALSDASECPSALGQGVCK